MTVFAIEEGRLFLRIRYRLKRYLFRCPPIGSSVTDYRLKRYLF
jgi:hypothetical protein